MNAYQYPRTDPFITGAASGVLGALMNNGSVEDALEAGLVGGTFGALIGTIDPSEGIGTMAYIATVGGLSGGLGVVLGQVFSQRNRGGIRIDFGEVTGAVVGGVISGLMGNVLGVCAARLGATELAGAAIAGFGSMAPATVGGGIGQGLSGGDLTYDIDY